MRASFYRHLAPIANDWAQVLRGDTPTFPSEHEELLARCHEAGQLRPTPLILRYGEGDWNALHQDLYGEVYFPFQVLTILARSSVDFEGGEFVVFPASERPNRGKNGYHRIGMRHGAATITAGRRTALGVIFHDAK